MLPRRRLHNSDCRQDKQRDQRWWRDLAANGCGAGHCATHCANLVADGKKDHFRTLRTCQEFATTCRAAGAITARKGPFSDQICTACAEICARCAKACEHHKDDAMMEKCAKECRACEKACREMLKHLKEVKK